MAYKKHEATIKTLRSQIRGARDRCEALMVESGATEDVFGFNQPKEFATQLSYEVGKKASALLNGYRAVHEADCLVRKSVRAVNYSFMRWNLVHAEKETRSAFIGCRNAIEYACWILSNVEDFREREIAAQHEADSFEVELPELDAVSTGNTAGTIALNSDDDPTEQLTNNARALFNGLKQHRQFVSFDTIADWEGAFRKRNPLDSGIVTALERLRQKIEGSEYTIQISKSDRRARLEKLTASRS